jgi:IclR family transcriptional regulator, acetate operon repressor
MMKYALNLRLCGPERQGRVRDAWATGRRVVAEARPAEGGVQSVHRALDVLEALAAAGGTASLGDLAAACALPAPTLHRIAGTLADRGYLRHTSDRRYSLGSRLVPLGADGRHTMRTFTEVGNRVELHCTGVGKALLAAAGPAAASRLIAAAPLTARTPATITNSAALQAEIALIRHRGHALDEGEMEVGVRCVAVGLPGTTPMAVSVSGPAVRVTDALVADAVSALHAASAELRRWLA